MDDKYYNIDIGYACFGITVNNLIVTEAPPIAKWMIGKTLNDIVNWIVSKRGTINEV